MHIIILGGTGSMGVSLVQALKVKGENVDITSRRKRESDGSIQYIQGNAKDDSFLDQLLGKKYDVIIDFMIYTTEQFKKRYQKMLNSTGQYFYLSSARALADGCGERLVESSPRLLDVCTDRKYLATDEYALAKARQEDLLSGFNRQNYTIIRPYITYNVNRLQLGVQEKPNWVNRVITDNEIVFQRDIAEHYTTLTYGSDVARAMECLIGNEKAIGEVFNIATNESHTWGDILLCYQRKIKEITGNDVRIIWQDNSEDIARITNKYQVKYDRLFDRMFDNSKLMELCGHDFKFTSFEDGISVCLKEMLSEDAPHPQTVKWKAFYDRASGRSSMKDYKAASEKFKYFMYKSVPFVPYEAKRIRNYVRAKLHK